MIDVNMDMEYFKKKMESEISNHLQGVEEIFSIKECDEVSERRNLNVIGIINALTTKVVTASDDFEMLPESKKEELSIEVIKFIEEFSKKLNKHPIDSIFYSIKMLSDILIQLSVIDEMEKENSSEESKKDE